MPVHPHHESYAADVEFSLLMILVYELACAQFRVDYTEFEMVQVWRPSTTRRQHQFFQTSELEFRLLSVKVGALQNAGKPEIPSGKLSLSIT
jgi:hypothetical protein